MLHKCTFIRVEQMSDILSKELEVLDQELSQLCSLKKRTKTISEMINICNEK